MRLILFYSLRNLLTRKTTTLLTAAGMALVVFVFAAVIMLAEGLERTLEETGSRSNAVVLRQSSETEVQSSIERGEAAIVETSPEIALGPGGERLAAKELVVLITLPRMADGTLANVVVRGVSPASIALRDQVRLRSGRLPSQGSTEIIVGASVAAGFRGVGQGQSLTFAGRSWEIVGVFEAGNTAFSSEVWGDVHQFMQSFRRSAFSSVLVRLEDPVRFEQFMSRIEDNPMLPLEALREREYYRKQSEMLATFLRILGVSLTVIFSVGAIVGAMITMYAAVSNRTGEIGTLRALGFGRRAVLAAFLLESLVLGAIGGGAGLLVAALLQFFSVSTTNFQTFAELSFRFTLTAETAMEAMAFALIMGIAGGLPPAVRASRMKIVDALRDA
jgi:putative ABC transport system permease protein